MTDAEDIVRALAAADPMYDYYYCTMCYGDDADDDSGPEGHEPTCPWRLAVEWVKAR